MGLLGRQCPSSKAAIRGPKGSLDRAGASIRTVAAVIAADGSPFRRLCEIFQGGARPARMTVRRQVCMDFASPSA